MRKFLKTINLLLCLELIAGPIAPSLSLFSSVAQAETPAECAALGLPHNSATNRCQVSATTANVMNNAPECAEGDAACFQANAQNALNTEVDQGRADGSVKNKGFVSTVANVTAAAIPLTMAIYGLKGAGTCQSVSYIALVAGGVSLLAGEILTNMAHKKRIKGIEKDWRGIVSPETSGAANQDQQRINATEAQSQAFEMLARSEDSMEKAAKAKKIYYGVAIGAFAVGATLATIEAIQSANPTTSATTICSAKSTSTFDTEFSRRYVDIDLKTKKQHLYNLSQAKTIVEFSLLHQEMNSEYSSPSIEEFEKMNAFLGEENTIDQSILTALKSVAITALSQLSLASGAFAQDNPNLAKRRDLVQTTDDIPAGSDAGGSAAKGTFAQGGKVDKFLTNPVVRAAFGALAAGWSKIMYNHAKSQAEASANRSQKLRQMRDEFKSANAALGLCKPEQRNDPKSPSCYCYTPEGQRNPNRSNSKICQQLFAGINGNAGNYYGNGDDAITGCIDGAKNFDASCKCKQTKSCMKAGTGSFNGLNIGTMSMLSSGLGPFNQLANGGFAAGTASAEGMVNNAMKIMAATKKLEEKAGKDFIDKKNKAALSIEKTATQVGSTMPSSLLGSSSPSLPSNPGEAARMLEKEIKAEEPTRISQNSSQGQNIQNESDLEFGLTAEEFAAQETQVAEVMKENLDYGTSDVNQGSTTNLFEVLSNRYQRSGLRRLFDEKGEVAPDKANATDVTK